MSYIRRLAISLLAILVSGLASAGPSIPNDSRSLGMGGTGVASARSVHAPHFNPALLSQWGDSDVFGLLLPQLGFMALDEDDLYESVTDFVDADYVQRFETNIDNITTNVANITSTEGAINTAIMALDVAGLQAEVNSLMTNVTSLNSEITILDTSTHDLTASLSSLSNKAGRGNFSGTLGLAFPSENFATALTLNSQIELMGALMVADQDLDLLNRYASATSAYSNLLTDYGQAASDALLAGTAVDAAIQAGDAVTTQAMSTALASAQTSFNTLRSQLGSFNYGGDATPLDVTDGDRTIFLNGSLAGDANDLSLSSTAHFIALGVAEIGFSVSRNFAFGNQSFSIGITPKVQQYIVYDYTFSVENADFDFQDVTESDVSENTFNMDVGYAQRFGEFGQLQIGVVAKNVMEQELTSFAGLDILLAPQIRAAVSYSLPGMTFALDADLTENGAIAFGGKTQYVMAGWEANAFNLFQIRLGYRSDMSNTGSDAYSVGLGLSPFGAHLDIAAFAGGNGAGAAIELALEW